MLKFKIPRLLNRKDPVDQATLLRRFMGTGLGQVSPDVISRTIAEGSKRNMEKLVKKALKKGRRLTVEDLTKTVRENAPFKELCEELGLTMDFFEGLAESAIQEGQQRTTIR